MIFPAKTVTSKVPEECLIESLRNEFVAHIQLRFLSGLLRI